MHCRTTLKSISLANALCVTGDTHALEIGILAQASGIGDAIAHVDRVVPTFESALWRKVKSFMRYVKPVIEILS